MTITNRFHLFAGVLSSVCLLGGVGPAAADQRGASEGALRVAQASTEQRGGNPETEEEKARRKKRREGAQEPAAPQHGQRRGHAPSPQAGPFQAPAREPDGQVRDRREQRRRSFGETGAEPPQAEGGARRADPSQTVNPGEQGRPRFKQHAPQSMPQPYGRAAPPALRPAEANAPAAPESSDPQATPRPHRRAAPHVLRPTEPRTPVPPQQPAARIRPSHAPIQGRPPHQGEPPIAAPLGNQQSIAQQPPANPDVRRGWRERLNESRERRREEQEKARQERRDEREQRRDEVQDERGDHAQDRRTEHLESRLKRLEEVQQRRRERVEDGGQRTIIEEPDKRVIIRDKGRVIIRHDETERFRRIRGVRDLRTERRDDGTTVTVYARPDGAEIVSVLDTEGRLLRRARRTREGREFVLIDNSRHYHHHHRRPSGVFLDVSVHLPAPIIRIPRHKYIVDYTSASEEDVYEALSAPPIERLERAYSLDEVRHSYYLRERMRRVDLDAINFEFGSWEVAPDQYAKLERVAAAMQSVLARNPDEVFLIEGHTDAVGSDVDNLSLSDRRAESVAVILSETFGVPPENLTTQGYGEQHPKVETEGPERLNRRVAVRRITPLLAPPAG
jgi:outer membrane protein OmpA-like peptidoglycan-associated protein